VLKIQVRDHPDAVRSNSTDQFISKPSFYITNPPSSSENSRLALDFLSQDAHRRGNQVPAIDSAGGFSNVGLHSIKWRKTNRISLRVFAQSRRKI
jgi:hypothetical protein